MPPETAASRAGPRDPAIRRVQGPRHAGSPRWPMRGACFAVAVLSLCPTPVRGDLNAGEREKGVQNLRKNVDRAFLWTFLRRNQVHPAPAKVRSAGVRLVKATGAAFSQNCHFYLVADPSPNAMASPGGNIFIYQGLLDLDMNDQETAAVVAHEVAHVSRGHWLRRLERTVEARRLQGYAAKVYGKGSAEIAYLSQKLENLQYDREEEIEADKAALQLLVDAGFNPQGLPDVLKKIAGTPSQAVLARKSEMTSTHPQIMDRVALAQAIIDRGLVQPRKKRLKRI